MSPPEITDLASRLWRPLEPFGAARPAFDRAFAEARLHYQHPRRAYHNLDHVRHVIDLLPADAPPGLLLAAWLHDVIYDSRAKDNEARSAEYARQLLASLAAPADVREETARLILLTATHETADDDHRGLELLDADLGILAEDEPRYDAYAAGIRQEYEWVGEEDYRAGRGRVLQGLLERPRIFRTPRMSAREAKARANLRREIARLNAPPVPAAPGARIVRPRQEGPSRENV